MAEPTLTAAWAEHLAEMALGHVQRIYPCKLDHVLAGPEDLQAPQSLHPVFHGSFDWHSCVHGYWLLARLWRRFPGLPQRPAIETLFAGMLRPELVAGECAYFQQATHGTAERPYGWGWLLALTAELRRLAALDPRHSAWHEALCPLADLLAHKLRVYLERLGYPVRWGNHGNSACAMTLGWVYSVACGDAILRACIASRARDWFLADRLVEGMEPCGEDFLSPTLSTALLMTHVMEKDALVSWLDGFWPGLAAGQGAVLLEPALVSDRSDGKLAHLDGLNLSRAWMLRHLARCWPRHQQVLGRAGCIQLTASLPHLADDYSGSHWLATFALLALDAGSPL